MPVMNGGSLAPCYPARLLGPALALLLALTGVEAAEHAVHHLAAHDLATDCAMAAAFAHLAGAPAAPPPSPGPVLEPRGRVVQPLPAPAAAVALRPDHGRAPPGVS
jgi:hypothetical protein